MKIGLELIVVEAGDGDMEFIIVFFLPLLSISKEVCELSAGKAGENRDQM